MPSALLVANPAARGFTSAKHRTAVTHLRQGYEVESMWPAGPHAARQVGIEAAARGYDVVVAMGGDGIVHHVVQGLVGSDIPLGIIPVGTANVLARQLGLPLRTAAAARLIGSEHQMAPQPALMVESEDRPFHRVATFSLGLGADAEIVAAAEAEPLRKRGFGAAHYAATAVRVILDRLGRGAPELEIRSGGLTGRGIGAMAQFRSSYTYFGNVALRISPRPPDPVTLLVVEQLRVRRGLAMVRATVGNRGLEQVRGFRVWAGVEAFEATSDRPVRAHADGEILGVFRHLRVTHRRDAFVVVTPVRRASGGDAPDATG